MYLHLHPATQVQLFVEQHTQTGAVPEALSKARMFRCAVIHMIARRCDQYCNRKKWLENQVMPELALVDGLSLQQVNERTELADALTESGFANTISVHSS